MYEMRSSASGSLMITEFRGFLEKAKITRRDVVKSATGHDLCWRLDQGRFLSVVRTLTWNAPGTGFSETTIRYPPPEPENIAPGNPRW